MNPNLSSNSSQKFLENPWFDGITTIVFGCLLLPMLAVDPMLNDGPELVNAALYGGALHPPGFPLQAWVNLLAIQLPIGTPAFRLSLVSALAHAATLGVLLDLLRRMGLAWAIRWAAAGIFCFFPSIWWLGIQPEVFAIAHLCMAVLLHQSLLLVWETSPRRSPIFAAFWLGLWVGLAAAQHPITITMLPVFGFSAFVILKTSGHLWREFTVMSLTFALVSGGFIFSLFALAAQGGWPNWGGLQSLGDLWHHLMRTDYGTFSLQAAEHLPVENEHTVWGLSAFIARWITFQPFMFLFIAMGLFVLFRNISYRKIIFPLAGSVLTGMWLLVQAESTGDALTAHAIVERFQGPIMLPLTVLIGIGFHAIFEKLGSSKAAPIFGLAALVSVITPAFGAYPYINASDDHTFPLFRDALSASISEDMVYIAASDIESTYGIYQESQVRFPIEEGLLSKSWYVKDILPTLDNRLTPPPNTIPTIDGLIQAARQAGLEVVSTDFQLLERGGGMPQLRGLIYVSHPRIVDNVSEKTVEGALKLCPFMEEMTPLNPGGHAFSHALRRLFARGFQGAAYYLKTSDLHEKAQMAQTIAKALTDAQEPQLWIEGCQNLQRAWTEYRHTPPSPPQDKTDDHSAPEPLP